MVNIRNSVPPSYKICGSAIYLLTFCIFFFILGYIIVTPTETIIQFVRTSVSIDASQKVQLPPIDPFANHKPYESLSFICDNKDTNRFPVSQTTSFNESFDAYRKHTLEKYCDIVPIPDKQWSNPQTYTEQDIAFIIVTSFQYFHTRAIATRDTWLSRITNYYFLSSTHYPYLPVTVVPGIGDDKSSNIKKLFYGLQIIYQQQMKLPASDQQKWFYIIDCDTFIIPHHLLKRLDGLDYTKPILLGGHTGHHECLGQKKPLVVEFPTGGAGFFFSMKLLELMQPNLTNYVENVWPRTSEISDVALTCLAAELGVKVTKRGGFWHQPPALAVKEHGRKKYHKEPEPNGNHYVKPDEMYALDEFYVNQHMDRLINDENWNELIQFTRRFISSHYELLRKKRQECILPKIENEIK
jgi:hypothetical protein